ncbi:50S ribosomal protein L11 methyltransferase [Herbivorax sp. ANBcel31]|uniref:50S ribosomal protein L11 methyltransferase n=1 Tax=Herbivorax sp. ANBcel31 TaxID=3069754 RepID=UPI0027B4A36A|nr:50S ribosomal protein L11 methyltransferase [Herbivorax sp. ANBcel31]MDQ2084990.1 50S ribosomal protein L11 methyltransferase [Herbivorax sp. ANBcel31]
MKWYEIVIKTTGEAQDAICEMLSSIGSAGFSIEDPDDIRREVLRQDSLDYFDEEFINSLGDVVVIKAYFSQETDISKLVILIKEKLSFINRFLDTGEGFAGYLKVDEEDWSTSWKKYYKPFHLTDKLVIKPSWEAYDKKDSEIVIELDPGMAFGTGTHETTSMCSRLLEKYINKDDRVIDVGCGTGILSIIASKLGASHITSVDIDDVAVKITKENSIINKVENIHAIKGVLNNIQEGKSDLIVANIIADVIIGLSSDVLAYLKDGGIFIASGIIKERKQEVVDEYAKKGFSCTEVLEQGEWVAIVLKCPDSL